MARIATAHHRTALRRGEVGAAGAIGHRVLAIAAVDGVDDRGIAP